MKINYLYLYHYLLKIVLIEYILYFLREMMLIADAILELFRKRENIDIFNKKALYIYIREMVDVKTPKITKIANVLYKIFKEKYLVYLEHGYYPPSKV